MRSLLIVDKIVAVRTRTKSGAGGLQVAQKRGRKGVRERTERKRDGEGRVEMNFEEGGRRMEAKKEGPSGCVPLSCGPEGTI